MFSNLSEQGYQDVIFHKAFEFIFMSEVFLPSNLFFVAGTIAAFALDRTLVAVVCYSAMAGSRVSFYCAGSFGGVFL